jgi:hypothetical protein
MTFTQGFPRILFGLSVLLILVWFYQDQVTKLHLMNLGGSKEHVAMVEQSVGSELENLSKSLKDSKPSTQAPHDQKAEEELQNAIQQAEAAKTDERELARATDSYKDFNDYLIEQQKEAENKKMKPAPIIISVLFGLCSLYIILSKKYSDEATKWACGTAGIILGFWLGGS